jgi:dolichyl-phosphate beta-glucosyltransferase
VTSVFLSVVIPVHNEEHRLSRGVERIFSFLQAQPYSSEVLVVENGSRDGTLAVATALAGRFPGLRVLREAASGKGLAVRRGMLDAQGEYRFICDVDFSMPAEEINRFLPPSLPECDVAIASREAAGAVRYSEPRYRHLVGRAFNLLVRGLLIPGLQDTQCGFKCFRAAAAGELFRRQTMTGFSFDAEVLFLARRRGYVIREVPIPWHFDSDSRVRLWQDSVRMGLDLVTIRLNSLRGVYDRPPAD